MKRFNDEKYQGMTRTGNAAGWYVWLNIVLIIPWYTSQRSSADVTQTFCTDYRPQTFNLP